MKSSIRVTHVRLLLAVSLASSAAAQGLGPEVLYTNLAGHPTAAVPGLPAGVEFFSGGQKAFNRPYVSPNGHWAMWSTTSVNNARGIILRDGEVILHQGQPVPGHPAETLNCFNDICVEKLGVNDAGFVAGSFHFAGNPNDDLRVMRHDPGTMTWSEIAREVGPANLNVPGSFTWGHLLRNASIDAAGDVAFEASLTVGAVLLMLGADPLFQMGTPPSNLPAFPVDSIPAYINDGYWIDASGSSWLARAVLAGTPADDVVVVDGAVVLREGFAVPGSGMAAIASGGLFLSEMDAGGNWYAGGLNVDGTEWIVRNGVVIAATGQTVAGGAEVWAQAPNLPSFFVHTGNAAGDWVVGGYTSAQRYALAVNAARVVWRQGDPIDLDADGSYDDGLLFDAPTELGRAGLTDDGRLFLVNEFTDATGVLARIGFFLVDATRGHLGTSYCDPAAANSTGFWAHLDAIGSPVVQAGDVALTAWRIPNGQFGYFLVSRDPGAFMPPGSAGLLCLSGNIGRYNRLTELIQGPSGVLSIDLGSVPVNPAAAVVPGDVWRFQCWYRDVGASSNFTNALEIAFQ